jgi:hypothetical protein
VVCVKGLIGLLGLVVALHAGIGCGVVHAAAVVEAPCCGQNCPMGSAVGQSACCHAQDSGTNTQEISRTSLPPAVQPSVGIMPVLVVMPSGRTGIEKTLLHQGISPPGAAKLALLCSRQI